jgi:hypothetical protein
MKKEYKKGLDALREFKSDEDIKKAAISAENVSKLEEIDKEPYEDYKKRHPSIQLLIGALGLLIILLVLALFK